MKNQIKGMLVSGILTVLFSFPCISSPLMKNAQTIRHLDVEFPFRCSASSINEGEGIVSSIALSNLDFSVRLPGNSGMLPRYYVNGFSFKNKTADEAIIDLVKSADIKVVVEEGSYPTLSAEDLKGELVGVLEQLSRQGNLFYTYKSDDKLLFLSHKAKAIIQVPQNKFVLMAVLDALNGAHLEPIEIDWNKFQIVLNLTRYELEETQKLMAKMIQEKYILAVQMKLYTLNSLGRRAHWQQVFDRFGQKEISKIQNGLVGQAVSLSSGISEKAFISAMSRYFSSDLIASGKVVVPSGWKMHFDFNQCVVQMPYPGLSVMMRTSVKKKNHAQTILTLDTPKGEIASFDFDNELDQKIAIMGIPVPGQPNQELLIFLQFQFIQLIKKGEQND